MATQTKDKAIDGDLSVICGLFECDELEKYYYLDNIFLNPFWKENFRSLIVREG